MIPVGCTSLLQPLDTAVNKPFKGWLREATEDYLDSMSKGEVLKWTVSDCRIITTHVVAAATRKLSKNAELVRKAFLKYEINIYIDSSQDHLVKIKDILNELINFTRWEL